MRIARTLAPVGYPVAAGDLLRAVAAGGHGRRDREAVLQGELAREFRVRTALAVSSGKAALTLILTALARLTGRKKVIIPAYTCYSVPSAIVKADLDVVLCDLAEGSFDYDYARLGQMLHSDVLCVLSVHLFGIPSDTARLKQTCRGTGIFVVEDAAQAFGGISQGAKLGTVGDVGIFSLGRGKNVTCGSGGVILTDSEAIAAALDDVTRDLRTATPADDFVTFVTLMFLSVFIQPRFYWLPAGLPFLRLGETIFHEDFPVRWLSDFQARLLRGWRQQLAALDAVRRENSEYYASHLHTADGRGLQPLRVPLGTACLRFPVLLREPGDKRRLFEQGGAALGMSPMYPATVAAIPQLTGRLRETSFPRAEAVAASLVTLPTHPLVTEVDRARICALLNDSSLCGQDARLAS